MIISGNLYLRKKLMRFRSVVLSCFILVLSCKAKDATPKGLKDDLMKTMQDYLYQTQVNNDSSSVKYRVEDVVYYDDNVKHKYVCEFTVHMKEKLFDTTGKMKAYISKDLKTVQRLY